MRRKPSETVLVVNGVPVPAEARDIGLAGALARRCRHWRVETQGTPLLQLVGEGDRLRIVEEAAPRERVVVSNRRRLRLTRAPR
jgi:hypothetical protein